MKVIKFCMHGLSWVIIFMLMIPPGIMAQDSEQAVQPAKFTKEELTQMLAPIALYPDSLIAQMLMASTYPIEVVEAERWIKQNKNLKGDELDKALQEKTWDSSVKSLCHFPDVLYTMSDNLERTTRLGDAFLSQQDDVMDTVQELRRKAQEQGNLKTTKEQNVVVDEQQDIQIEPVNPDVVYVPVYDPLYVYGPWWYPAYPPYYWFYPPGPIIASGIIGFGFGIFIGFGIFSWCWFDWHHHHVDIDMHKTKHFNRFDRGRWDFERHIWNHEPEHRRGVAYRDRATSQRFGVPSSRIFGTSPEARGYTGGRIDHERLQRPQVVQRPPAMQKPPTVQRPPMIQRPPARGNAFSGVGNGNFERRASERGFTSRQSGGFRSGGGLQSGGRSPSGGQSGGFPGGGFRR